MTLPERFSDSTSVSSSTIERWTSPRSRWAQVFAVGVLDAEVAVTGLVERLEDVVEADPEERPEQDRTERCEVQPDHNDEGDAPEIPFLAGRIDREES